MSKESTQKTLDLLLRVSRAGSTHPGYEILQDILKRHGKDDPSECINEIRLDGSNTFANIFRGWEGVDYDEIVEDVAKVIGVKKEDMKGASMEKIEELILAVLISKYWDKLSDEEKEDRIKHIQALANVADKEAMLKAVKLGGPAIQGLIQVMGPQAAGRFIAIIIMNQVGRQAAGQFARFFVGQFIPVLNVILLAWLAIDIAGPAYRKIIPTVASIAILRGIDKAYRQGEI